MSRRDYDVVIVGAGPAGIFACFEILDKDPKINIALIDMGSKLEGRKSNEVMSGFGGAGSYSDGKLHYTPNLSHERALHLVSEEQYVDILDTIEARFKEFGVDSDYYPKNAEEVKEMVEEAADILTRRLREDVVVS